jgi:hypothetical protein
MNRLLLVLVLLSCSPNPEGSKAPTCATPQRVASLPPELNEASGVAVSRRNAGMLWVHNDSGDPILYALDTLGNLRGRVRIAEIDNNDWEDIAAGDCHGGSCLYIGAIGDNYQIRSDRAVYIVPEPAVTDSLVRLRNAIHYRFPANRHDTEALFVINEKLYLITKGRSGPITLYALPRAAVRDTATLQPLQTLTSGLVQLPDMVTAAAATPDGKHVLIRTYSAFQMYKFDGAQLTPLPDTPGHDLQKLQEVQGEGADITGAGVIYLVSEKGLEDRAPPLSKVVCQLPAS